MALQQWALPKLRDLLPLEDPDLEQIVSYTSTLSKEDAAIHFGDLLGDSPAAMKFIASYNDYRDNLASEANGHGTGEKASMSEKQPSSYPAAGDAKGSIPAAKGQMNGTSHEQSSSKAANGKDAPPDYPPPSYAPPPGLPPSHRASSSRAYVHRHTNQVIEAANIRAQDEQEMQQLLQNVQLQNGIYNTEIEPEHDSDYPCGCEIHRYQARKFNRYGVQDKWSKAVLYPGEKAYNDNQIYQTWSRSNPYRWRVVSPYGYYQMRWGPKKPIASYHAQSIQQTIALNNELNAEAQTNINAKEPNHNIWEADTLESAMSSMGIGDKKRNPSLTPEPANNPRPSSSKMSSFRKSIGIMSSDERAEAKVGKAVDKGKDLRDAIIAEERGRWPDEHWRYIVQVYQDKVGMLRMITDLRARRPIQYLHLLRAGYFEPIPVAWADQISNPLKFRIEAGAGWRGITPAWRGYEDTAEERLYWVLNHREGSTGVRLKPDFMSAMEMARARMASAVEPPPLYFSASDTCHVQHTSAGYSKQVMPAPFRAYDRPETSSDETMILLDVSGSMDFEPLRPVYDQYLITGYVRSTQPKNKDVAKSIIRRFTDAMANHDHQFRGYEFSTFANHASHIGTVNHQNFEQMWRNVRIGGGTRVMTGWQKVKELHFQKHSESATHHPVYGWQAGPETPMLRLLLLLDGEATDMDEFELDLLGLSWAHVTIFLIGVDGCPHHHRHANELQRISDVNHHVSFVDAQGNCPERFVTHELLKRHLGYELSMNEFERLEELPSYEASTS